jgi:hypothetical protein
MVLQNVDILPYHYMALQPRDHNMKKRQTLKPGIQKRLESRKTTRKVKDTGAWMTKGLL